MYRSCAFTIAPYTKRTDAFYYQILKRKDAKGPKVFLGYGSNPIFWLFMVYRKKNRCNLNYENSKISPRNPKSDTT
jgi:hypothetical protein